MKKIVDRQSADALRALIRMGKARAVKEHSDGETHIAVYSASGMMIGVIGQRYRYMFENALMEQGSGDGLLEGCSQTTAMT
jgi:hypothetical protein